MIMAQSEIKLSECRVQKTKFQSTTAASKYSDLVQGHGIFSLVLYLENERTEVDWFNFQF